MDNSSKRFMRNRRTTRRFRYHSNGRGHQQRNNGGDQARLTGPTFLNDRTRNNFKSFQSSEQLVERYNVLAKEALSVGDKTLSENYLQHADHFVRIIKDKSNNKNLNRSKESGEAESLGTSVQSNSNIDQILPNKENKE